MVAPALTMKFIDTSAILAATSNNGKPEVAASTHHSSFPNAGG